MGESGETERQGETVSVEKDEHEQNPNLTPEEAKIKAAEVKKNGAASDEVEINKRKDDKQHE